MSGRFRGSLQALNYAPRIPRILLLSLIFIYNVLQTITFTSWYVSLHTGTSYVLYCRFIVSVTKVLSVLKSLFCSGLWAAETITWGIKYRNTPSCLQGAYSKILQSNTGRVWHMDFRVKPIYIVPISVALVITHLSKGMFRERRKASCLYLNFFETL